jgi:ribonuclease III
LTRAENQAAVHLEAKVGYKFKDLGLLTQSLTHGSNTSRKSDYERLEFLGDRVLGLVIADHLYANHKSEREGKLAARHSAMVRGEVCAEMGEAMGLADFIVMGATEKRSGIHKTTSVLGDVVEAVIGAIYIDGGLEAARGVILRFWSDVLKRRDTADKDAKTFVQEWALGKKLALPKYQLVDRSGPEHKPNFTVELTIETCALVQGQGPTKQAAEMDAAKSFIQREGLR